MNRYREGIEPQAAAGWQISRLSPPSGLYGANGMQFGPDGKLYVAQAFGSQVSALDTTTGACQTVSPVGGPIVAPDDLAFDSRGGLFAATSTGGTCCKLPGRIGDSPLIGCGCYADAEAGGVSSTGYGEAIMKVVMAKAAVDILRGESSAIEAAQQTIALFSKRTQATAGLILLDRDGNPGFAFNTPRMAYGYVAPDGSYHTAV